MRARVGVTLVLVASTLLAGLIGMRPAAGQAVLHLVLPASTQTARFIDHHDDGLRLGDRVAARGSIMDADGTAVGMAYGDCLVHRRIRDAVTGLWNCTYLLDLDDGDLILQGLDPRGPGSYEMAVLGGTGAYVNASGDATFTDSSGDTGEVEGTDMVIRLAK